MKIPTKTLTNGFEIPVYGFGLWQMGGRTETDTRNDTQDITALQAAITAGVTHFDTAEIYGAGHAEELLGEAICGQPRQSLLLATKVSPANQSYDGVQRACAASLKRLKTDYIDLYLLHRYPAAGISAADTMSAMDYLVEQGLVRNIGVSNMTCAQFSELQGLTQHKLVCNQVHYNIQERAVVEQGIVQYCQDNDVILVAWRPLEKGNLHVELLAALAKKYDKTPAQIAINWLVSQKNVVTISKTSNIEHLYENLGALNWTMDQTDLDHLGLPNGK
jgi:diketogulonate reductase-like aldo/keto reductase